MKKTYIKPQIMVVEAENAILAGSNIGVYGTDASQAAFTSRRRSVIYDEEWED